MSIAEENLDRLKKVLDTGVELTDRQKAMLLLFYLRPNSTVRGTAKDLNVRKPVVSRSLVTFKRLGFVRRRMDPHDGRNVFLSLTITGRNYLEQAGFIE